MVSLPKRLRLVMPIRVEARGCSWGSFGARSSSMHASRPVRRHRRFAHAERASRLPGRGTVWSVLRRCDTAAGSSRSLVDVVRAEGCSASLAGILLAVTDDPTWRSRIGTTFR